MLAKSPLYFPECLKFRGKVPQSPCLFDFFCSKSVGHGRGCCNFSQGKAKWKKPGVLVRAGYTRKPMDTSGAYQLVDEETGEKFIVWGDDNSPIPSKEVLSWKPTSITGTKGEQKKTRGRRDGIGGIDPTATTGNSDDSAASIGGLGGSFGRLKAQRIRSMIKKSSQVKQENDKGDNKEFSLENTSFKEFDSSDSEHKSITKKTSTGALEHRGRFSRASQSQDVKDSIQDTETILSTNHSEIIPEHLLRDQITVSKPPKHDFGVAEPYNSVPKAAAASLRQWNNGEPTQKSTFNSTNLLKKHHKMSDSSGFFGRKSFRDLGCTDYMIESLRGQLFLRPSHIQAMAFVPIIEGKTCIVADQSGSGKTLAYLAPVIQRLRQEELQGLGKSSSRSPRVIILVPTAELASQVLTNCRSISKFGVPFRSMVVTGGFRQRTQLENLQQDLDVLIATPGRFIFLLKEGFLQLTNLRCAVLDEVDILYGDEDFERALQSLINSAPVTTQYLFVTATLPVDIYNQLVEVFPDCEVIMGPGMHRTSSGLEEILVDCSGDDGMEKTPDTAFINKKNALLQLAEESPVSKTIIFCNKIETCRKVENVLKRFDRRGIRIRVLPFHSALAQESRLENMKEFLNSHSKEDSLFLICTDRASRGIDFSGVDHVVLFDFPRDPSEYVRRVGRTARGAGGQGKAFVFVVGKQVSLARRIIERNKKGHPLHDVPSAYELVS